jgi:hypothetical protein
VIIYVEPTRDLEKKSCTDVILALKQFIEKSVEYNHYLHLAFVDQEKAFDRVDRKILWQILKQYEVNNHLTLLCANVSHNNQCKVRTNAGYSEELPLNLG